MKEKRGFKAVTIFFVLALAVMSVLLVSMILSGKQVDGTEKSPVPSQHPVAGGAGTGGSGGRCRPCLWRSSPRKGMRRNRK